MSTWLEKSRDAAHASRPPNAGPLHSTGRFQEGASWQREALLSEETVERAARVGGEWTPEDWENDDYAEDREFWKTKARSMLTAALGDDA